MAHMMATEETRASLIAMAQAWHRLAEEQEESVPPSAGCGPHRLLPSDVNPTPAHCRLARLNASDRAPTKTRLKAQVASRLNQLRDTNLRPR